MKILSRFLRPLQRSALERILANKDFNELKRGTLEVDVAVVRGDTPEVVSERMGLVAEIAMKHGAVVDTLVSSMVIVTFGMFGQQPTTANRDALIQELRQRLQSDIKIIHCAHHAVYGVLGSSHFAYTFVVDGFIEMLGQLNSMQFGEAAEFGASDFAAGPIEGGQ